MFEVVGQILLFLFSLAHPSSRTMYAPNGLHLAFTETSGELSVTWLSFLPQWEVTVSYRPSVCNSIQVEESWSHAPVSWLWNFRCYPFNWEIVNYAKMSGLSPACTYEYQVGSGVTWTKTHLFSGTTPYQVQNATKDDLALQPDFIVFGDLGRGNYSDPTRSHLSDYIKAHHIHAALHSGDIAYNLYNRLPVFARLYFDETEVFAASIPYMVAPGNHERSDNFTQYKHMFRMPVTTENEGSNFFYSFNLGRVHIVVWNPECFFLEEMSESEMTQINWLVSDLKEANLHRETVPWIVTIGHRPLYCGINWRLPLVENGRFQSNFDCSSRAQLIRDRLEDVFYSAGVDLIIESHVHNYERNGPVYKNASIPSEKDEQNYHRNPAAPIVILSGTAGNEEGNDLVSPTPDPWLRSSSSALGFGRLQVFNQTHLYWEQWDSTKRQVIDYVWVEKTHLRYI